jgi:hypothetical protein
MPTPAVTTTAATTIPRIISVALIADRFMTYLPFSTISFTNPNLFLDNHFQVADFLLHFPEYLFAKALAF